MGFRWRVQPRDPVAGEPERDLEKETGREKDF